MSALVTALDKEANFRTGENGHIEHRWAKGYGVDELQERVVQFYFQLVRTKDKVVINEDVIAQQLDLLLTYTKIVMNNSEKHDVMSVNVHKEIIITLYKILAQTRDIVAGKGEYHLAYVQLAVWWKHYPSLAKYALHMFVNSSYHKDHPYGSWKDIKNFCQYANKYCGWSSEHPFVEYACKLMEIQLRRDIDFLETRERGLREGAGEGDTDYSLSLAGRWAPRESSKQNRWIANKISEIYFQNYFTTAITTEKYGLAKRKASMEYRKKIVALNRELDTIQIKMCEHRWGEIDHTKTTSQTLQKSKNSIRNVDKRGDKLTHKDQKVAEDRELCAKNFMAHLEAAKSGDERHKIRGKRIGINNFVKDALRVLQELEQIEGQFPMAFSESRSGNEVISDVFQQRFESITSERDILNMQWSDNASQNTNLRDMVVMVDTSGSMMADDGIPLHSAIGLGIRIAEKSTLGKRIMTFSSSPEWVNLDDCKDFLGCVDKIRRCNWGMNTDFYKALKMILDAIVTNKMKAEDVENLTLVVLSDMQIDESNESSSETRDTMFKNIEKLYSETGIRICGQAYKPPHIVFWNLRRTNGFPSSAFQDNVTMTSGFSPVLLNQFSEKGVEILKTMTPWTMIKDSVNIERYDRMEKPYDHEFDEVAFSSIYDDVIFRFE